VWEWEEVGYKGGWEEFRKEAMKKGEAGDGEGELEGWITKRPKREKKKKVEVKARNEKKVEKGKGREKVSPKLSTRSLFGDSS